MKKALLATLFVFAFSIIYAQNETSTAPVVSSDNINYKQAAGDKSLELGFNPINTGLVFEIPRGFGVRFRKFNSETIAFRIGVDLIFAGITDITQQKDDATNQLELKDKFNRVEINIRPGLEKHFLGSERLSPYIGGEVILGWQTSTTTTQRQVATAIEERKTKNSNISDGFKFGLGAIAGVDFYVAKQLYLGFEINYTFTYYSDANEKITDFDGTETILKNGSAFVLAPQAYGLFRIGYLF